MTKVQSKQLTHYYLEFSMSTVQNGQSVKLLNTNIKQLAGHNNTIKTKAYRLQLVLHVFLFFFAIFIWYVTTGKGARYIRRMQALHYISNTLQRKSIYSWNTLAGFVQRDFSQEHGLSMSKIYLRYSPKLRTPNTCSEKNSSIMQINKLLYTSEEDSETAMCSLAKVKMKVSCLML